MNVTENRPKRPFSRKPFFDIKRRAIFLNIDNEKISTENDATNRHRPLTTASTVPQTFDLRVKDELLKCAASFAVGKMSELLNPFILLCELRFYGYAH
jgi:hypothetical protein